MTIVKWRPDASCDALDMTDIGLYANYMLEHNLMGENGG